MVQLDQAPILLKILADSIMIRACVKIGMIRVIVFSATAAFIFMIEAIIRQVGNLRKTLKNLKDRDGKE